MMVSPQPAAAPTKRKMIAGISVIFDWGMQDRGASTGRYSQSDVVEAYGYRLNDELDDENVRTFYVDTRCSPARTEMERLAQVPTNYVPIFLSCDWHKREREHNASVVEFSGEWLYPLAEVLCFHLSQWGQNHVFGHRVSRPVVVEGPADYIRVKPFALNGPKVEDYMVRLDKLGVELGRAIGLYLSNRGEGLRR